ncbi:MAG: DNA-3-methyladenine glycosylase I [Candidatus Paceibacterota bacterium]|jgi:DNA-3-methyladenine glycosylase I
MRVVSHKKQPSLDRCPWPALKAGDALYTKYHDEEWGVPTHDDRTIYEFLTLEIFQAGLSWRTVLYKRENFRKAFAGFDYRKVARFTRRDVARLLKNAGIIRNRAKIEAAIENAQHFMDTQREFGLFANYMWQWVGGVPIVHRLRAEKDYPAYTKEAIAWAKDLKKRGFRFLGPTVVYAHMQAVGMVNDHTIKCFRRSICQKNS